MSQSQCGRSPSQMALITGASYGIGMAIAKAMAANGATIVFNDIKQELVDKGLASYAAVSYTHLDVYKRQALHTLYGDHGDSIAHSGQRSVANSQRICLHSAALADDVDLDLAGVIQRILDLFCDSACQQLSLIHI